MSAGHSTRKDSDKRRLLVVDDEPSICELVRRVAEQQGFEVATALTHEEYKAAYDSFRPSAILLDMVMPNVDGFEVLEQLRREESTRDIPVLCLSGRVQTRETVERHGATAFLLKPAKLSELLAALRGLLALPA